MTTRVEMQLLRTISDETVKGLLLIGENYVAGRLARCSSARASRTSDYRHWSCRNSACPWCGRAKLARWYTGLASWVRQNGDPVSVFIVPLKPSSGGVQATTRIFRRRLRDLRDRAGRRRRVWRAVMATGMLVPASEGWFVLLHVQHRNILRAEVMDSLKKIWPETWDCPDPSLELIRQPWAISTRVQLAVLSRGTEPLRIVLPPQNKMIGSCT